MASQKLIAVLGATGNQGGSVVNTFIQDPEWRIRAITRNPASDKAQKLASRGVEVVSANLDDPSSLESAFKDAQAIFVVSNFWDIYGNPENFTKPVPGQALNAWTAEQETQQLKNAVDAASKVMTLERLVISSVSNTKKWSKGKYTHIYHFNSKANAVDYAEATYPELWAKTSIYQAGFFIDGIFANSLGELVKTSNEVVMPVGHLSPDVKLPFIAQEEDTGPYVKALIHESTGKNLVAYRAWASLREVAEKVSKLTGTKIVFDANPFVASASLPPDLAEEFNENMAYCTEFGYAGTDPTVVHPASLQHCPRLPSLEEYLVKLDLSKFKI